MKLLYLHQYFATPNSNGGTRSYEMARRFVRNGHDVTFVTSSAFLAREYSFSNGWNFIEIEGIKLHVLHLPYSNKDSYLSRILKFLSFSFRSTLKSLSIRSDVVFATSTPLTIAIPGYIYSKLKSVPMVFEVRDLWPELPVAIGAIRSPLLIKLASALERLAYRNSKHLVGLSPGMCEGIVRQGIDPNKVTLATNSCDTEIFDVPKVIGDEYREKQLDFVGNRKLIVYTGTFGVINDVEYIVQLAKCAKENALDLCFLAIGDGMEKQKIIDSAEQCGVLNDNLYILPPVPKTEIVKLLSSADLALSLFGPIREMWHNSANKLFDALASCTPVAINYGGWQKDLIERHKCGLVLDEKEFSQSVLSIDEFLNNEARYIAAKMSCKDLAYNHYSRDIMAEKLENVLVEAVNDKKIV